MKFNRWIFNTTCFILIHESVLALPQNPQVVEGNVSFQATPNQCLIESSDRAIIHWDGFSIAADESVHFSLPSSQAAVLNRVVGGNPSELFGQLHSNGALYLINPHGIIIGKEGLIHVGSLLASTLDISNHDFLEGKELLFSGDFQSLIDNQGRIIAESGDLVFLAEQIKNGGDLFSPHGMIVMGAGREITYLPYGNEKIQIELKPQQKTGDEPIGICQQGSLRAQDIELKADGNLYSYAIKQEGIAEATSIENRNGHIYLVAQGGINYHSGSLTAPEVQVLGDHIRLEGQAIIDASSAQGGGTILIGGDYQGSNPNILNANTTVVAEQVTLSADATLNGDGGKIIVWADEITSFYGTANVHGGIEGGNGGFVEVSGKDYLDFQGLVYAQAPQGKMGSLLLDPTNITISAAATSNMTPTVCPTPYTTITTPGTTANILNTQLNTNLASCSITISTAGAGAQAGTIVVSAPITWTSDNSLTLNASSGITISANITNITSNVASLTLNSGTTTASTLTISSGATVQLSGPSGGSGTLTLASNATAGSDMTISGAIIATNKNLNMLCADDFILSAGTGSITFASPGKNFTYTTTPGAGSVSNFAGPVTITDGDVSFSTGGLSLNNSFSTAGSGNTSITSSATIATGTAGTTTHASSGTFSLASTATGGTTIVLSRPFVQSGGPVTISAGTGLTINSYTNNSISSATTLQSGLLSVGTLTLSAGATMSSISSGPFTLNANTTIGSDITLSGNLNIAGSDLNIVLNDDFNLTAGTGSITFNSPGKTFTYTTTPGAGSVSTFAGPVTITDGDVLFSTGALTINNPFLINGTGTVSITAGGAISANASGVITMNSPGIFSMSNAAVNSAITLGALFTQAGGNVTVHAGAGLSLNGGYINNTASSTTTLTSGNFAVGTLTLGAAAPFTYGSTGDLLFQSGNGGDININNAVTIPSANTTISPSDDFTLNTTGAITYSAIGKNLTFTTGPSTSATFNGPLTVTGGNLSITTLDDLTIGASPGKISYDVVGGFCDLTATGGIDPDVVINGTLEMINGILTITANDDILQAVTGSFTHHASTTANLLANGPTSVISLEGTTSVNSGSMIMQASTGISIPTGGTFTWTSPGSLSMTTTTAAATSTVSLAGTISYSGGPWSIDSQGDVSVTGFGVPFTYNPPGALSPFTILSHLGTITLSRSMSLTTPSPFSLTTLAGDIVISQGSITNTSTGPWTLNAADDLSLGTHDAVNPTLFGSAGGAMLITVGDSMFITSSSATVGANAILGFSSGGQHPDMTLNIGNGLHIEAYEAQEASIRSPGELTMTLGGDLVMIGKDLSNGTGQAVIEAYSNLTVSAENITLIGSPRGQSVHTHTLTGDLLFIANTSISTAFNANIHNHGSGSITLVVDQQAPFPPTVGSGLLDFFGAASLKTDGGPIRLFATSPSQTHLPTTINNLPLSAGTTVFNTWYSTFTGPGSFPYTIFYKTTGISPTPPNPTTPSETFHELAFASAQVNQQWLERTMGWHWLSTFNGCNTNKSRCVFLPYSLYQREPFEYPLFVQTAACHSINN